MWNNILKALLWRPPFKGQFRLFSMIFNRKLYSPKKYITTPCLGNFKIHADISSYIDASVYFTGDYEYHAKKQFAKLIKKGDAVIDAGANIGFHSLFFAELVGKTGKVYAFEPMPKNISAFKENLALNKNANITLIEQALGSENTELDIYIDDKTVNPGSYNLFEKGKPNTHIICVKGDDFISEVDINKIDFIKIDVEGYELEVLKGFKETLKKLNPIIVFEFDRLYQLKNSSDPTELFTVLENLGYQFKTLDQDVLNNFTLTADIMTALIFAFPSQPASN